MKKDTRTPEDNQKAQLENEVARLNKKIAKYEAVELKQNRFGLVWLDVPEAFEDDVENKLPILEEVPKLAINSKDNKPTHLLIEGDNYHALTCLNYTHKGKVDVIYIDPPYNTGSDGFKYKDKRILDKYPDGTLVPVDHPLRHSYWLSFMKKRLELARDILRDDGVIFISIDDNEYAQLKLLCDEIFIEKNLIALFTWVRKRKPSHLDTHIRKNTEYVLCYAKNIQSLKPLKSAFAEDNKPYPFYNSGNTRAILAFPSNTIKASGLEDGIYRPQEFKDKKTLVRLLNKVEIKDGIVVNEFRLEGEWRYSQKSLNELIGKGEEIVLKGKKFKPYYIRKLTGDVGELKNAMTILGATGKIKNNGDADFYEAELQIGTNEDAEQELSDVGLKFNNPKPVSLIKFLIKIATVYRSNCAIILDFFAGSGTTGQAVMVLNEEDQGNRQFILATNNDEVTNGEKHKIMTDICYPRIKKVIKEKGGSVKYFKTAFVGKNNILEADDADKIELAHNAGGMLAIAENTFDQVEQNDNWQIFEDDKQYTAIYFKEEFGKFDDFAEKVRKLKKPVVVYIFSWEKEFEFDEFDNDKNIKVKTIPQPILEIYKQIYNLV